MMSRFALLAIPLILLAGCGDKGDGNSAAPAAPVAAVAPPSGQQWSDVVSETPDGGYRMGNPNAPIKLVEYGSRTCPHCALFDAEGVPKLKSQYVSTGKVSYEFRDYPVHASLDMAPILLGRCVDPSSYFPMLDQMMANQQTLLANTTSLDQNALQGLSPSQVTVYLAEHLGYLDFVKARGVPEAKARACLNDKAAIEGVAQRTSDANQNYNITGTPTFILNGRVLPNTGEWEQVEQALKAAGA
jgi:protein-disulfide isomerase